MKYYTLKYKYLHTTSEKGNIGDNIQSISVVNMLKKIGVDENCIDYVNRDDLSLNTHNYEKGIFITQGWFGCMPGQNHLPITHENLFPVYFGFHLNEGSWHFLKQLPGFVTSLKKYEPIGCRDIGTRDFLRSLGVKAFFSRCLTLTFDLRKNVPQKTKNFIIDLNKQIEDRIPSDILQNSVKVSQENYTNANFSPSGKWPLTDEDVEIVHQAAIERLNQIREEATLVITSRIHIAMPAISMGIPVVFFYHNEHDVRTSVVKEIVPIYNLENMNEIDWAPQIPNIESIKNEMQSILKYQIQNAERKNGLISNRLNTEEELKVKQIIEEACEYSEDSKKYKTKSYRKGDIIKTAFCEHHSDVVKKKIPIVMFGAGSAGRYLCSILKYADIIPACFCDNKVIEGNEYYLDGLEVISFEKLKTSHMDSLILVSTKYYKNEIINQLLENGFTKNQIVSCDSLIDKYIDFAVPQHFK